jgi:hypothetical protein
VPSDLGKVRIFGHRPRRDGPKPAAVAHPEFAMNKTLALAVLLAAFGSAQATGLAFVSSTAVNRSEPSSPTPGSAALIFDSGTPVTIGELMANTAGTITFTYLGQGTGLADSLRFNGSLLDESATPGLTEISGPVNTGSINFSFFDNAGGMAKNPGRIWLSNTSIGLIGTNLVVGGRPFEMVLGFNDSAGGSATLGSWDDFIVGVNLQAAVPEPGTFATLAFGLLGIALFARGRRPPA